MSRKLIAGLWGLVPCSEVPWQCSEGVLTLLSLLLSYRLSYDYPSMK